MKTISKLVSSLLAFSIAGAGVMSSMAIMASADSETSNAVYGKDYTVSNVLTDFQCFVHNDFSTESQTIGSIAVGGTCDHRNYMGDGQLTPSYVNTIKSLAPDKATYWYKPDRTIYYGTNQAGSNLSSWLVENPDYIDMDKAFDQLSTQSRLITKTASDVTAADIQDSAVLTVDVNNGNITVPWSVMDNIDVINITGYDNADWFRTNDFAISVTDMPESENFTMSFDESVQADVYVQWNGTSDSMFLYNNMTGGGTDISTETQKVNIKGMKLVWNFPDAKRINIASLNGHLVAPDADVDLFNPFIGGVVADSFTGSNNTGYFYTYDEIIRNFTPDVPATTTTTPVVTEPVETSTTEATNATVTTTTTTSAVTSSETTSESAMTSVTLTSANTESVTSATTTTLVKVAGMSSSGASGSTGKTQAPQTGDNGCIPAIALGSVSVITALIAFTVRSRKSKYSDYEE